MKLVHLANYADVDVNIMLMLGLPTTKNQHVGFAMTIICRKKTKIEMEIPSYLDHFLGKKLTDFYISIPNLDC